MNPQSAARHMTAVPGIQWKTFLKQGKNRGWKSEDEEEKG